VIWVGSHRTGERPNAIPEVQKGLHLVIGRPKRVAAEHSPKLPLSYLTFAKNEITLAAGLRLWQSV